MFTIDVASLRPGLHEFEFVPEADELGLEASRFTRVQVGARLDVQEGRMLVLLNVVATATLECDRTLQLFDQEIGDTYDLLFVPPDFVEYQEDAFDEVRVLNPAEREIDLTDAVRDTVLLSVPQRCVAPGAEDEIIETQFGAPDDGIDPRWEALRTLKSGASRK